MLFHLSDSPFWFSAPNSWSMALEMRMFSVPLGRIGSVQLFFQFFFSGLVAALLLLKALGRAVGARGADRRGQQGEDTAEPEGEGQAGGQAHFHSTAKEDHPAVPVSPAPSPAAPAGVQAPAAPPR